MSLVGRLTRAVGERGASQVSKDIFWRVTSGASQVLKDILSSIPGYPVLVATLAERLSDLRLPELLIRTTPIGMNHLSPARVAPMREIISRFANDRPINLLEIGTWFGAGSTALFLEILPRGSSITLVDSWRKYHPPEAQTTLAARLMDLVPHAAISSTLRQIYKFEEMRPDVEVIVVRGVASRVLTAYKPKIFDCIYVDGSHYYDAVKADLQIAKYLLKDDGVLCGDDYLLPHTPELIALAKSHLTTNFLSLPDGRGFYPGVLLAISEELPKVNMQDGFWWTHLRSSVNVELARAKQ